MNKLKERYPEADLLIENRAIGGYASHLLVRAAASDLYPFYPDLVVFHDYGGGFGKLERMFSDIRRRTCAEIMVFNHHLRSSYDPDNPTPIQVEDDD